MNETERSKQVEEALEKGLLQFRIFDKHTRKALINNEIIFGAAKNFNDPFDCNLPIDTKNTPIEIEEYFLLINKNKKYTDTFDKSFMNPYMADRNKLKKEICFRIYDFRRFSCFNINSNDEAHENSLFWAHYADKHNGICMKFRGEIINTGKCFNVVSDESINSFPIDYSYKNIPEFNYLKYRIEKDKKGYEKAKNLFGMGPSEYFFGIKSGHWKHEKEVRFVFKSPNDLPVMDDYINIKFNPKLLEKVYVGCNASQSTIEDVKKIMHLPNYKHVNVIQLIRNKIGFKFTEKILK
jgi:hypothetical protein